MIHGLRSFRGFIIGLARVVAGTFFAYLSITLVARTLHYGPTSLFSTFAIGTFLAALAVDALIGDTIRKLLGIKR